LKIGDIARYTKTFTPDDVLKFAELTGDSNPIHLDENFARNSIFGRCIVHGALTSSLISKLLGTELPGIGTIYLNQNSKFLAPVFVGDTVEAVVEIDNIDYDRKRILLKTTCLVDCKEVMTGVAEVMYKSLVNEY
jgi:3-hydroxybutyryl-CoA dehydratase